MEFGHRDVQLELAPEQEAAFIEEFQNTLPGVTTVFTPDAIVIYQSVRSDDPGDHGRYRRELVDTFQSTSQVVAALHDKRTSSEPEQSTYGHLDNSESFQEWLHFLPTPELVRKAAKQEFEQRNTDFLDETAPCLACAGKGCDDCLDSGKLQLYPELMFHDILTMPDKKRETFNLDIAQSILNGDYMIESQTRKSPDDYGAEHFVTFNADAYIKRQLGALGIDVANSMLVRGDSLVDLDFAAANVDIAVAEWMQHNDDSVEATVLSADDIMRTIRFGQRVMASYFAIPEVNIHSYRQNPDAARDLARERGQIINDEGVVESNGYVLHPVRELHQSFNDLLHLAAAKGYLIGIDLSPLNGSEFGPAVHIFDSSAEYLRTLTVDYSLRAAIENAWLELQKL